MTQTMIFDLDGTLFQTETLWQPAYYRTFDQLRKEGLYQGETPPEHIILNSLGMLLEQIWLNVLPDSPLAVRERANEIMLEVQLELLQEGVGELYPKVEETLQMLREKGIRLFVASNGLEGYVKGVVKAMGIAPLFEALYSAGEFQTRSKVDLVRLLSDKYGVDSASAWMVGDRSSDVEAGKGNQMSVVGCNYAGFGSPEKELQGSDRVITSFDELLELV